MAWTEYTEGLAPAHKLAEPAITIVKGGDIIGNVALCRATGLTRGSRYRIFFDAEAHALAISVDAEGPHKCAGARTAVTLAAVGQLMRRRGYAVRPLRLPMREHADAYRFRFDLTPLLPETKNEETPPPVVAPGFHRLPLTEAEPEPTPEAPAEPVVPEPTPEAPAEPVVPEPTPVASSPVPHPVPPPPRALKWRASYSPNQMVDALRALALGKSFEGVGEAAGIAPALARNLADSRAQLVAELSRLSGAALEARLEEVLAELMARPGADAARDTRKPVGPAPAALASTSRKKSQTWNFRFSPYDLVAAISALAEHGPSVVPSLVSGGFEKSEVTAILSAFHREIEFAKARKGMERPQYLNGLLKDKLALPGSDVRSVYQPVSGASDAPSPATTMPVIRLLVDGCSTDQIVRDLGCVDAGAVDEIALDYKREIAAAKRLTGVERDSFLDRVAKGARVVARG